ncbi:MAG: hypothetical protein K1X53_01685, partial [Candidatus Sumerlaeaceae bacterium]|nr:hypothetical protein [Candidatus Sumerlaeaceae bacterium]
MARILKLKPRNGDSSSDPLSRSAARKRVAAFGAWAVLVIVFAAVVASVSPTVFVPQTRYRHGGIWDGPAVTAPFAITVVDKSAADLIQAELEQRHEKVFEYDTQALPESQVRLDQLLKIIASDPGGTTSTDLRKQIISDTGITLSRQTIAALSAGGNTQRVRSDLRQLLDHFYGIQGLASMPDKTLLQAAARQRRLAMEATGTGLVPGTTATAEKVLGYPDEAMAYLESVYLPKFALSKELAAAYAEVARQILRPNVSFNRDHTNLRLEQAMKRLLPRITVNPGDVIIQRGQPVTGPTASLLEELNRQQRTHNLVHAAGNAVVLLIAILFLAFYVRKFSPEFSFTSRDVLLLALPA